MGFFEMIYSFLMWSIGARTDAASSTGSLFARLARLQNDLTTILKAQKARASKYAFTFSSGSTSTVTVVSVSGKGKLNFVRVKTASASAPIYLTVIVDGVNIGPVFGTDATSFTYPMIGATATTSNPADNYPSNPQYQNIEFTSSLVIQMNMAASGSTGYVEGLYALEQ